MDFTQVLETIKSLLREIRAKKFTFLSMFVVIAFSIVMVGVKWPLLYESTVQITADNRSSIQPLLKGQAELTQLDRTFLVREVLNSEEILREVALKVGLILPDSSLEWQESAVKKLLAGIDISKVGKKNISISYRDESPDMAFKTANAVTQALLSYSEKSKRSESRDAYEFMVAQVESYKANLQVAEKRLEEFNASNRDGTEKNVQEKIAKLKTNIQEIKLGINEMQAVKEETRRQLNGEGLYLAKSKVVEGYKDRILRAQAKLDELLLNYTETYPDVVNLRRQINDMELAIQQSEDQAVQYRGVPDANMDNPLYEELRSKLASAEVELRSRQGRLASMEALLADEYARLDRIAARRAELKELTRDSNVTRKIYNNLLESKEKARLSMTLEIEDRGISYTIYNPAEYPRKPVGLLFWHFALAAPIIGFIIPVLMFLAFILVDPRFRLVSRLRVQLPDNINVIGVIPTYDPFIKSKLTGSSLTFLFASLLMVGLYLYIVISQLQ